jgi:hypothetical protein
MFSIVDIDVGFVVGGRKGAEEVRTVDSCKKPLSSSG